MVPTEERLPKPSEARCALACCVRVARWSFFIIAGRSRDVPNARISKLPEISGFWGMWHAQTTERESGEYRNPIRDPQAVKRDDDMETISAVFDEHLISAQDLPPKEMIFGQSEAMRGIWQIVERVAGASVPILIVGENGSGKEVLARFIHSWSFGTRAPFLRLSPPVPDVQGIDGVAFHVEYEGIKGGNGLAGNGSSDRRLCTLFIEKVDEVGPGCQQELLQLIQGFRSLILNDGTDVVATLRVIGASTHDLEQDVASGKFREDLFWFLNVVTLRLPPLRERKEDIPQLAIYFWKIYSERFGCRPGAPSPQLIELLQQHDWLGNIRELENVMKRYVVLGPEGITGMGHSGQYQEPVTPEPYSQGPLSLKEVTRHAAHALERKIILKTLQETQWNRRQTARVLNISYRALLYKIKEAGLISEQPRSAAGGSGRHSQKLDREVA